VQAEVHSKPGEVYALGPHRLWCGDNTDPAIRAAACAGVGAVVTDPPYGIGYNSDGAGGCGWVKRAPTEWDNARPPAESFAWLLSVSKIVVLWGGNYFTDLVPPTMGWLIWDKGQREFSLADCEMAWTSRQKAARVITYSRGAALQDGKEHPTQKPIAVMVWTLEKTCEDVAAILDPYGGSGTTLLACAQTGRVARLIELDPAYCDVIRRRWTRYAREAGIDAGSGALDG
jgi:site-specific DNA-methyltransferase (adenine-specific)